MRASEYARLDAQEQVYLDFTGGGLHAASQVQAHVKMLNDEVLGNPHSVNPSSTKMTHRVEQARTAVLDYFNGAGEYTAIFTLNASAALKLVGEAYPFTPGGVFLLSYDNHNSVNGIREFACHKGAAATYIPVREEDLRLDEEQVRTALHGAGAGSAKLFAYPAQSNSVSYTHLTLPTN